MIGTLLDGRFKILELLREDGTSRVYKARHELLVRLVAIKIFQTDLAGRQANLKRFQRESKALCSLNHPNIIKIYDSGVSPDGEPYLVMDYLEGESLAALLRRTDHLTGQRVARILSQTCAALNHAHQQGVIHTALQPDSIVMVSSEPDLIKIVDFGIARLLGLESPSNLETQTDERFGAPLYMSPEQCMGREMDVRSDIYSLACVMYEALYGSPPFNGDTPIEIVSKHLTADPMPPPTVSPDDRAATRLVPVILKALKKSPGQRYQSMDQFKLAVQSSGAADGTKSGNSRQAAQTRGPSGMPGPMAATTAGLTLLFLSTAAAATAWLASSDNGRAIALEFELAVDTAVLPQKDPRLLSTAGELIALYDRQEQYGNEASILIRMLPNLEVKYGAESKELFEQKKRVGQLYLKGGRKADAEKWVDQLLRSLDSRIRAADEVQDIAKVVKLRTWYLEAHDSIAKTDGLYLANALEANGKHYVLNGEYDKALPDLLRSYNIRKTLQDPADIPVGRTLHYLAWAHEGIGQTQEAHSCLLKAYKVMEQQPAFEDSYRVSVDLAVLCRRDGRLEEAESWYKAALDYAESLTPAASPGFISEILLGLADTCRREKKLAEAERYVKESLAIEKTADKEPMYSTAGSQKRPKVSTLHCELAEIYIDGGKISEAESECKAALKSTELSKNFRQELEFLRYAKELSRKLKNAALIREVEQRQADCKRLYSFLGDPLRERRLAEF